MLVSTFGYQSGTMPLTYLGLPLGITKPQIQEFMPLLSRIERRLMGITPSYTRRLTLCNWVLSSILTYFMCMAQLHVEIIEHINKYRHHYIWRGSDFNKKIASLLGVRYKGPKIKVASGLLIWQLKIKPYSSNICIKFSIRLMSHGWI
jgi:hypothetical protein